MSKTFTSLLNEAEHKMELWQSISNDEDALSDRNKTREEAAVLANYFEGMRDSLVDVKHMIKDEFK